MVILLVDDDDDDQYIFREAVTAINPDCELIVANDGIQGLSRLAESTKLPDYIFLDVNMPRMDGKEFLKSVKSSARYQDVPVIIYSTSSQESEIGKYFQLGASNYITKPSEFSLLLTYLRSLLQ